MRNPPKHVGASLGGRLKSIASVDLDDGHRWDLGEALIT